MPRRRSRSTGGVPASPPISGRGSWGSWPSLSCPRSPCGGSVRRSGGGGGGAVGPRPVLTLPYQNVTAGGADGWFGEGIAETLSLAARTVPSLLPIDATRVVQAARAAHLDLDATPPERVAAALARALRAEVVFYGEYQRTADGGISIVPRLVE